MRGDEISASIAHLLIRHPIAGDDELSGLDLPLTPSLLKTLLLRRLGSLLSSGDPFDEALDTLELVAELDGDHALGASPPPSPSLQRAYCALAVDAAARWLKKGDWGGFLGAVERNWRVRAGDLAGSEARGLASEGLRREAAAMEEAAAGNGGAIEELRRRDTSKEAYEAAVAYFKEAVGPTIRRALGAAAAAEEEDEEDHDDQGVVGGEREGGEDAEATTAGEHGQAVIAEGGEAATTAVGVGEEGHRGHSIIVDAGDLRGVLDGVDSLQVIGEEGNRVSTNEEGGCSKNIRGKKKKKKNAIEEVGDGNNVNEESMSSSPNPSNDLHTRVKRKASVDAMKNIMESNKKRKFWTTDEEDVMRKAVSEYGEGKWKQIKNSYPGIFGERSPIDLKDKWRNMKAKVN